VPEVSFATVAWYRKDLAEKAGVKPPTNWDELLTFAKATTQDGVYGFVLPVGGTYFTTRILHMFIRQNGGFVVDEDLNVAMDSAENRETLAFLKELFQYSPPGSGTYAAKDILTSYTSGSAAMVYYQGRQLQRVASDAPALLPMLGAIPAPYKKTPYNEGEPKGAILFKGSANRDLAKKWLLEYQFAHPYDINWLLTAPLNSLPVRTSVETDALYTGYPLIRDHADIARTIIEQGKISGNFRFESPNHKPNRFGGALDRGPVLPTMLQRYLLNGESADSVLAYAQKEIKAIMAG
jgi:multiple sugar transport system substrate-binding protein